MTADDRYKASLQGGLRSLRSIVVAKLDGIGEYERRRPVTPTGTNLLGLVKHLAGVEYNYFGLTFDRPMPDPPHWMVDDSFETDQMVDFVATPEESTADVVGLYQRVWAHADTTIAQLPLEAHGRVRHWGPDRNPVTLHQMLVHVTVELGRHAGHVDIVRETIDGVIGLGAIGQTMQDADAAGGWAAHVARVEAAARAASR